jgi:hypothetical protein
MAHTTGVIGISSGEVGRHASFYDELTQVERPDHTVVSHAVGLYVNENRHQLAEHAIALGADWIWYVDDDHCFRPDTLTRLLAHDVDIVSGLYVRRVAPFLPVFYEHEDADGEVLKHCFTSHDRGLKPVLAVGAGCLLVKTHVHQTLGAPYWRVNQTATGDMVGEDIDFCRRARQAGFTVWCDMEAPIGHYITAIAYPHQPQPGEWTIRLRDAKGSPIVEGPAAIQP